jgi:EAL domain-containing protein (putative c-di-GMP-specific phosphodiesterase class I)
MILAQAMRLWKRLKHMPFTELKVDRIFAHGAAKDPATRAMLESSIKLGRAFGLNVVVEGIEIKADCELVAQRLGAMRFKVISLQNRCHPMNLSSG